MVKINSDYAKLSDSDKILRLEICARMYIGWLGVRDPQTAVEEDCTCNFEEMLQAYEENKHTYEK